MDLSVEHILKAGGYLALFLIVFAESGLLIGFFLPGDSLLFTAGILASQGYLEIALVVIGSVAMAIAGDSFGYSLGRRFGPRVFKRDGSLIFTAQNIERSQRFYEKHGGKTIVLARFTPVVRTFAPILAGVGKMQYRRFLLYNVFGALAWAITLPLLGYYLGKKIPNIEKYLLPVIGLMILASITPPLIHVLRSRERRQKAVHHTRQYWQQRKARKNNKKG